MFFGALHHMGLKKVREKMQTLVELLQIPSLHRRIANMRYKVVCFCVSGEVMLQLL